MTITAELYAERGVWKTDSAYVFASNDPLTVSFGKEHAGQTARIKSARHVDSLRLDESGCVLIPEKFIEDGAIVISVEAYINGKLVYVWRVDPLTVKANGESVTALPWIASIEERISDLENAVFGQSSPLFE